MQSWFQTPAHSKPEEIPGNYEKTVYKQSVACYNIQVCESALRNRIRSGPRANGLL